ncbi:MAG TPA: hypothetical protein VIB49_09710 [Thermoplasmata archaeon]
MSDRRTLAILSLLIGLLAAILVLLAAADIGRSATLSLEFLTRRLVDVVLGIGLLLGSVLAYRGQYTSGGITNLVLGIVVLIIGPSNIGGILGILSGILALLANESRR